MARKKKTIIREGVDARGVGYYATPRFVADFLSKKMLKINPTGKMVLDPAVGKEELLDSFFASGKSIDSFDIINYPKTGMSNFSQRDFLEVYMEYKDSFEEGFWIQQNSQNSFDYDYYICNPPYNCHEVDYIRNNKTKLKSYFSVGVHNMYSLFLSALIDIAKPDSLIGVIVADSFLTSNAHSKLREQILCECAIHSVVLCPTSLFRASSADVRTCILVLQKGKYNQGLVEVLNRGASLSSFREDIENEKFELVKLEQLLLNTGHPTPQFVIGMNDEILRLFLDNKKLSDVFKCVTCISTGDDARYLSLEQKPPYSVPFYKNPASHKFKGKADAYLIDNYRDIALLDRNFMLRNKTLVGQEGIACSSMGLPFSAVYLPKGAVTGVNPTIFPSEEELHWLLSYLNSSLVTYLVRGVLIRTNMVTSGYINALPVPDFSEDIKLQLSMLAMDVLSEQKNPLDAVDEIDRILSKVLKMSASTSRSIKEFARNLNSRV